MLGAVTAIPPSPTVIFIAACGNFGCSMVVAVSASLLLRVVKLGFQTRA